MPVFHSHGQTGDINFLQSAFGSMTLHSNVNIKLMLQKSAFYTTFIHPNNTLNINILIYIYHVEKTYYVHFK